MILVLQLCLGTLGTGANGFGIVAVESATGLSMEELRTILIETSNQQRNTEGTTHDGLLAIGTLAEAQGQVADGLGAALDAQSLVIVESMALAFDAGVLDHGAGISLESGHGAANVAVDLDNLLDRRGLEECRGDTLLDTENNTLRGGDTDGRGAKLDGLERVFDLEETTFGGEGVDASVWRREDLKLAMVLWWFGVNRNKILGISACKMGHGVKTCRIQILP